MLRFINWLARKAARDTSTGQFIPEIDGLRFLAIFSVILYHLSGYVTVTLGRTGEHDILAAVLHKGFIGVQLFFVISGFVIALPFAKAHFNGVPRPGLSKYFFRRITRLEPPYIANLLIIFTLLVLIKGVPPMALLPNLASSIVYLHNLIYGTGSAINTVAWSLEVELQFYLLAPLLTFIFAIRYDVVRRLLLALLIMVLSLFVPDSLNDYPAFAISIIPYAKYFLSGFLLLDIYLKELPKNPEKSVSWDLVSLCAWGVFIFLVFAGSMNLLAPPIILAYYASFKGTVTNRFFTHPVIYTIGGMCYTIYLYHFQLISVLGRPFIRFFTQQPYQVWLEITLMGVVTIPLILLFSTLFFIFIEKPCMKRDWYIKLYEKAVPAPR